MDPPDESFGLNSSLYNEYSDKSYYAWKDVYGVFDQTQENLAYILITQKIVDIGNAAYNGILKIIMKNELIGDSKNDNVILRKQKNCMVLE